MEQIKLQEDGSTEIVPRRQVLVVDDSRAQRVLLCRALSKWGYSTLEADSGEAAFELCQEQSVDLVISDWMMPGMSGVEFCKKFRGLKGGSPAYFILLTAQTDRETLAEGLDNGADDFLSKPFHSAELKARISAGERILDAQRELSKKNQLLSSTLNELQEVYSAVDRDLREARSFQEGLVPERFRRLGGADLSFMYRPSGHVGGDLVGYFRISESRYGVYSVDVSGHGVASALMTARIAGLLSSSSPERNLALSIDDMGLYSMHPPEDVCARLNSHMLGEMETDTYLTMVLAEIDIASGQVTMAHAGHPSPAVLKGDGTINFIDSFGMPIGLIADAEFGLTSTILDPGDRLLFYSDGLTECPVSPESLLEEDGLKKIMEDAAEFRGTAFLASLEAGLEKQSGLGEFPDDLSAVLIEMHDA